MEPGSLCPGFHLWMVLVMCAGMFALGGLATYH